MIKDKEKFHEKNISAKQKKTPKNSRFSHQNENRKRPKSNQQKKKKRAQVIGSLDHKFPPSNRLKRARQFAKVTKEKNRIRGRYIIVDYLIQENSTLKLGIVASKKFGKSNERNRFKRIARESFRLNKKFLNPHLWIIIRPRPLAKCITMKDLQSELISLLQELKSTTCKSLNC